MNRSEIEHHYSRARYDAELLLAATQTIDALEGRISALEAEVQAARSEAAATIQSLQAQLSEKNHADDSTPLRGQ